MASLLHASRLYACTATVVQQWCSSDKRSAIGLYYKPGDRGNGNGFQIAFGATVPLDIDSALILPYNDLSPLF
jgi:hypothetical protein